jgi:hypothetical protein
MFVVRTCELGSITSANEFKVMNFLMRANILKADYTNCIVARILKN